MKRTFKCHFLCAGFLLLASACPPQAQAAPKREVNIGIDELQWANEPLEKLANALRRDKKSSRFQLQWFITGTIFSGGAEVLYDRRSHTIKFNSSNDSLISEEPVIKRGRYRESYLYHGVTDKIVYRLAAKHKNANGGSIDAFFSELPLFGCRKQKLLYKVTYWTPK